MAYRSVIDVSENQGAIDFQRMAAAGVDGVIPRAGINGRRDHRLDEYVAGIRANGRALPAVYWFANPRSSTGAAAQGSLLAAAATQVGAPRGMIDAEWYSSEGGPNPVITGLALARWYAAMADAILQGTGLEPIIYTSATYWNDLVARPVSGDDESALANALARLGRCELILARYPVYSDAGPKPGAVSTWGDWAFGLDRFGPAIPTGFKGPWSGWQFSAGFNSQGSTYGAASRDIDLNIITEDAWARWTGATPTSPTGARAPDSDGEETSSLVHVDPTDAEKLSLGSRGANVRTVQVRLAVHGYATDVDGSWGPVTDGKVRTFQGMRGLAVDGVINVPGETWSALNGKPAHPTVRPGTTAGYVGVLQRALNALGNAGLTVDGAYSISSASPTRIAIQSWQQQLNLAVDGVCGQQTWATIDAEAARRGYTVA
jgi:peptidoglycan hydrolase-like protein with peptidoglycan-binding domain/GH25 family lysozyme M1 (1,4-beta-N-acetylmuramidase)